MNNGETFQHTHGMNQVCGCSHDARKMVKLPKCDYLMEIASSMNHRHGW